MFAFTTLRQHRGFFVVIAFVAVLCFSNIWAHKEFVRAESYFALGSRLMIERNQWLAPHTSDERELTKPPLNYWLIGISYKLFGISYGTSRLPTVLAAMATLAIVYVFALWMHGIRTGLVSAAILASSYLFLSFARLAMSDMLLTLWVTAALASFVVALTERTAVSRRLVLLGYVALALGVLTKGPAALAVVSIPVVIELGMSRGRTHPKDIRIIAGLTLFVLIGAPYFLVVYGRLGAEPLRFFFVGENLGRFTGQTYQTGARPFWFELAAFFSDFAPWSLLVFPAAWFHWRRRNRGGTQQRPTRILYLWLLSTVFVFSLASFKRDYYLLPAMPAAALIIGTFLASGEKLSGIARRLVSVLLILCSILIGLVAVFALNAAVMLSVGSTFRFLPLVGAFAGGGAILGYVARQKIRQATMTLAATIGATVLTAELVLLPAIAPYLPGSQLAPKVPADRVLYTSWAASPWTHCLAFNLSSAQRGDLITDDEKNVKLRSILTNDPKAVAVIWELEYPDLVGKSPGWKILAQVETFGHGGLSLKMIRDPKRERLLMVGREP